VLDDDCVTEMSVHYGRTRQEVKETLAEWRYDYFTATYLLLLNKKCKGRPVRLARPRVLMHRQLVRCVWHISHVLRDCTHQSMLSVLC